MVFAVEKIINSKLLVPGSNRRLQTIDKHIGVAYSGLLPDGRHFVNRGREDARSWKDIYKSPISVPALADHMGGYAQAYTLYNSVRPFGITAIVGGVDADGSHLYTIEPSGTFWGYRGAAAGKGRQTATSELEKLDLESLTAEDAVKEAARIIYLAHEDSKDKEFELEISWVSKSATNGIHKYVSDEMLEEAKQYAIDTITGEDDEMEE